MPVRLVHVFSRFLMRYYLFLHFTSLAFICNIFFIESSSVHNSTGMFSDEFILDLKQEIYSMDQTLDNALECLKIDRKRIEYYISPSFNCHASQIYTETQYATFGRLYPIINDIDDIRDIDLFLCHQQTMNLNYEAQLSNYKSDISSLILTFSGVSLTQDTIEQSLMKIEALRKVIY